MSVDFNAPIDLKDLIDLPVGDTENQLYNFDEPVQPKKRGRKKKVKETIPIYVPKPVTKRKIGNPNGAPQNFVRGEALSEADKDYIGENARKLTVEAIADNRGKRRTTVYKFMEMHGLLSEEDKRDGRIKKAILNDLHNYSFWRILIQTYSPDEIDFFEEEWYSFIIQLDDNITATERMQLKQLIDTQIRMDRLAINERKILNELEGLEAHIELLREELREEKDGDERDRLQHEITQGMSAQALLSQQRISASKDIETYLKSQGNLIKDLDVTRSRRVEKYDISDKTWAKMLMEQKEYPRLKRQMAAMAYITFLAIERMRARLTQPYTYADGEEHSPMLLPEGLVNEELGAMVTALYVPSVEPETTSSKS